MTQPTQAPGDYAWQARGSSAQLQHRGLAASVDLQSPHEGLGAISVFGGRISGNVLGIGFVPGVTDSPPLAERYPRGSDLIVAYEQSDAFPFRATLYWRAVDVSTSLTAVAVDLIVSVQTNLLDLTPQLRTISRLKGAEALTVPLEGRDGRGAETAEGGCVAFRLAELATTYVEMIHPSDWRGVETKEEGDCVELRWPLVGHFMEKGVIRRLRVRGIFLQGTPDDGVIHDLYAQFASSPPPLTT